MTEIKLVSEKCFQLSPLPPFFFLLAKKYQKKGQKSLFQRDALKLQILEKTVPFKKCQQPPSWGSFKQCNEYKKLMLPHTPIIKKD